jgi:hypothetical protein
MLRWFLTAHLAYAHMHMHICTYAHMHICTCTCTCTCTHAHIHIYTHTHTHTHIHTYTHIHTHIHTHTHDSKRAHAHTYIHACTPSVVAQPTHANADTMARVQTGHLSQARAPRHRPFPRWAPIQSAVREGSVRTAIGSRRWHTAHLALRWHYCQRGASIVNQALWHWWKGALTIIPVTAVVTFWPVSARRV